MKNDITSPSNLNPKKNYSQVYQRVVMTDSNPWFVAKDVCDILEIVKIDSALRSLDDDEKGTHSMSTLGGTQSLSVISEPGLYSLVLRSRKLEVKLFKRWITHDVLPAIRQYGPTSECSHCRDDHPLGRAAEWGSGDRSDVRLLIDESICRLGIEPINVLMD